MVARLLSITSLYALANELIFIWLFLYKNIVKSFFPDIYLTGFALSFVIFIGRYVTDCDLIFCYYVDRTLASIDQVFIESPVVRCEKVLYVICHCYTLSELKVVTLMYYVVPTLATNYYVIFQDVKIGELLSYPSGFSCRRL